ncbi:hypothetical protein [Caldanaerobacter subterraneus]|uniref:DUF4878 domain-containing protein n=1 Tax=Caldanaerobacter subterraneus TaxID=911092 RepID=A0A7Y2L5W7_9THEO|nr:hypothetical protein [Caldanaerobacter subterraneus]NNG66389.1 hypothetical protein [Caldanaerobacter subterraneus]
MEDRIFKYIALFFFFLSLILGTVLVYISIPDRDLNKIEKTARDFAFYYTNYDYKKAEDYYDNMIFLTTGQLQEEFKQENNAKNIKLMKSMEVQSSSKIDDIIFTKLNSTTAKAVAFVTIITKSKSSDPRETKTILYMRLKKVNGSWKVYSLEPY